jgi:hypothetical protein
MLRKWVLASDSVGEITVWRVPYGWITIIGFLILLTTLFQNRVTPDKDFDFHAHEWTNESSVTITTSPEVLGGNIYTPDNSNWHLFTSYSTMPIRAEVKFQSGSILSGDQNLTPNSNFWYETVEPNTITIWAL